jgi:hypothetical protein
MKIKVYSRGETDIDADAEYQEPAIREAIEDGCNDVPSAIIDYTDNERSNISHDEYAVVTEDDGRWLWRGWLHGGQDEAEPDIDYRALLDKATTAHHNVGLPGEQKIANAHRREAGLEELT